MSSYNTTLEVYYCKQSESPGSLHRIAPAPSISISPEIYYANDNIIGYTYTITLRGYANAIRKDIDAGSTDYGLDSTVSHMGTIRDIFNVNGGNLYIKQGSTNILVAKGATIKNIQFSESDNRWVNYSPFSIEIEFNEIDFQGCDNNSAINCNSSIFHQIEQAKNISDKLVDIKQYKIKEFSDKWTIAVDNKIYEEFDNIQNNTFTINYNISATGKNYYINDNLVPAWQQARMFVQDKLYKQVSGLINGSLQIEGNNDSSCTPSKSLDQIHNIDTESPRESGLLASFNTIKDGLPTYDIYNETISCNTSEADGTFSVDYNAIIKKYDSSINPSANAATHTYTKDINTSSDQNIEASITIKGTVQGLARGGFIYYNNDFVLPANGTFITSIDGAETKYGNALNHYTTKIGSNTDLSNSIKDTLNIKKSQLLVNGPDGYPQPSSFTLDHNYQDGQITYSATYERSLNTTLQKGFTNISIVREDPVDMVQEFIIPGRIQGPIIQKLNMKTPRTISVNIDGAFVENKGCDVTNICYQIPYFSIQNFEQLLAENNTWLKTKEDYAVNKLDGSYSISLEYIVRSCI